MLRYRLDYRETLRLRDGAEATLRLLTPADRPFIEATFEALSDEARYARFFTHKRALSERELNHLAEVDLEAHVALGAVRADGRTPLGVARFVRLGAGSDEAEAAVAVVDAHQGQGLGRMLLERLGEAAYERGLRRLHFTTLADNAALGALVRSTFATVDATPIEDGTRTYVAHLSVGAEHPLRHLRRTQARWSAWQLGALGQLGG